MYPLRFSASALSAIILTAASITGFASPGQAQSQGPAHFRVLLQYPNPTDAGGPTGRLIRDEQGNLYGVGGGGPTNRGVAFKLSPNGQETILHIFGTGKDGSHPVAGLVRDSQGNLYGTTSAGGAHTFGTVFRLTPGGDETILHSFRGEPDGAAPDADLLLDAAGNLYGTTWAGGQGCTNPYGASGCGTVFEITAAGKEKTLYSFADSPDGAHPTAGLVADRDGNLYGTTAQGGTIYAREFPLGTVFRLTPDGQETVLYRFNGSAQNDGQNPNSTLVWDEFGNLYGTTTEGGANGYGTVFRLGPTGVESVLYAFPTSSTDGKNPEAGLVRDREGNLYGTAQAGGDETDGCAGNGCGVVFRLAPNNNAETILHSFTDTGDGGCEPNTALALSRDGRLYGTTLFCGTTGNGTIFELRPSHDHDR